MRHRDKQTVLAALKDWKVLREKVNAEGGDNYEKPVLVKFLDTGTFEVMDRDIVEDEFYVLRRYKILRELKPDGADLQDAIRDAGKEAPKRKGKSGQKRQGSRRGGRRRGRRRTGRRGSRSGGKGGKQDN
jgi:hypothetical protein